MNDDDFKEALLESLHGIHEELKSINESISVKMTNDIEDIGNAVNMVLDNHMQYPTSGQVGELYNLLTAIQQHCEMIELSQ